MIPLASMLVGHQVDLVAVLDCDEPGRREGRRLVDKLFGDENRTVFVGDHTPDGNPTGGSTPTRSRSRTSSTGSAPSSTARATGAFEKPKVARALADAIETDPQAVPAETVDAAKQIFHTINRLFSV
jgi:hypothetical protein